MEKKQENSPSFQKTRDNLLTSLQNHLENIYLVEKQFTDIIILSDVFPFNPNQVEKDKWEDYEIKRGNLRDLFIDETNQLEGLIKAIRQKKFNPTDSKQLLLLILGYVDIADSAFQKLFTYSFVTRNIDEMLESTQTRFVKLRNLIRLLIKGVI
ncbi:hypothetical protein ACFSC6_11070 [Rufibacter sediminis]|uniref:Uncharacterized protein n=1 Tax=Rufibacter sediminis TaxID=2762756 RepID=A0ABR6VT92_9BACT|nr:hypothetical protein [Rufibacter sediminis]MBC3540422.1 hypothetical protein [Rufibacter sediminis]